MSYNLLGGVGPRKKPGAKQSLAQRQGNSAALVKQVLSNPSLFPDEFLSWLPRWLGINVNFKVAQSQLPARGAIHTVGASGEVAVFLNSWVNYNAANPSAAYYIDSVGVVHLTGIVKSGTPGASSVIFTLPAGFRPQLIENYAVASNNLYGTAQVKGNGDVIALTGSGTYFSLCGISFRQFS